MTLSDFSRISLLGFLPLLLSFCKPNTQNNHSVAIQNKYAQGFSVQSINNLKILSIYQPWGESKDTFQYVLFPRDTPIASELNKKGWISIPIESAAILSSTHVGPILMLNQAKSIKAVHDLDLMYNRDRFPQSGIRELGSDQNISIEKALSTNASVIFSFGTGGSFMKIHDQLQSVGVHLIPVAEYLENSPLAQAEWIKFFSEFYDMRTFADSTFEYIDSSYQAIKSKNLIQNKKTVLLNFPWEGVWYLPGKDAYITKLIDDAGGTCLISKSGKRGSYPVPMEEIIAGYKNADVWINPGANSSLSQLKSGFSNASYFGSFKNGYVFNHSKRSTPYGADDYFESAVVRPDLVLRDLSLIFSNEENVSSLMYYNKLK